ncbi:MAG: tRNA epoxyqueuosine(34) reductase QueG [Thiomicrospira sp.]|uniref:tRNA epoxyqueuosine(34) reductase QueG n=1 Tax=Thiomicrospira sp. TaxID=935 RepID=UPI0019EDCD4D|nr:tRNA epoxyqueuosine(34) reductase QueG [Thiomicrospira sp.]MBE0494287.1 tRNA epoxyqueuosine(34) reductase QueG [Thiomicrospira sp.]
MNHTLSPQDLSQLAVAIKNWATELGFADSGITHTDLSQFEAGYFNWLAQNFHGEMHYMQAHGTKRTRPTELLPGTASIISLRMNYFDLNASQATDQLHAPDQAYISRYALGRDYHKLIRQRLKQLVNKIQQQLPDSAHRIFVDSAPVLERPIAQQAGLGFIGKNSLIIHPRAGSWFFLAEIYTDLNLPADPPFEKQGCGPCTACIQECPTQAILADGIVDARRCISYLTIEHASSIPLALRPAIGNRIYGCDDCQLVCPWNHFTQPQTEPDFEPRWSLDQVSLLELFDWSELDFNHKLTGSPIRRIGYERWNRNIAIALGNGSANSEVEQALEKKRGQVSAMVDEHIEWALEQLKSKTAEKPKNRSTSVAKPWNAPKYYLARTKRTEQSHSHHAPLQDTNGHLD